MKDISRFLTAQEKSYPNALAEVKKGKKTSHWIWYIFPQIKGLGYSPTSNYYGIEDLEEAKEYLENDTLHNRLVEISQALLNLNGLSAHEIFGSIDAQKVKSSMTLFHIANPNEEVFKQVLDKYYDGVLDENTIEKLHTVPYQKQKGCK